MYPQDCEQLTLTLMQQHGLISKGWTFEFDNSRIRFGLCDYKRKLITLSKLLVCLNPEHIVKDTILHEIAHALLRPSDGHNWVWRRTAQAIGCTGQRCYGNEVKHRV